MKDYIEAFKKEYMTVFLFMLAISICYVLPIISADRYYIDDIGRSIRGYAGWSENGRPLADILMISLSLGLPIIDLSPMPLVIGLSILCLSISIYTKTIGITGDYKRSMIGFAFICNPFLLENLSYKYDALPMTLSISLIFLAFSFSGNLKWLLSIALVICTLSLYQSSLTVFCSLTVIEALRSVKNQDKIKDISLVMINRIIQFIFGYAIYAKFIAPHFLSGGYNSHHSDTVISYSNPIEIVERNSDAYLHYINLYLSGIPLIVVLVLLTCVTIGAFSYISKSKRIALSGLLVVLAILSVFLLSFIHLTILVNPVFAPRVLIPFGCLFLLCAYLSFQTRLGYIFCLILTITSFTLSFTYGNAMKAQKEYETYLQTIISSDINSLNNNSTRISFIGSMPKSDELKLASTKFPILEKLIPVYVNDNWVWGGMSFLRYGLALSHKNIDKREKSSICSGTPIFKTKLYHIYDYKESIVIRFNNGNC